MALEGKAHTYRERAEELRVIAEDFHDPRTQRVLSQLAIDYENMALGVERMAAYPHTPHDYRLMIFDKRYSVPTLQFIEAPNPEAARHAAERILADTHHTGVEVWEGDRRLLSLGDGDPSEQD
jgi:hypothetical protein